MKKYLNGVVQLSLRAPSSIADIPRVAFEDDIDAASVPVFKFEDKHANCVLMIEMKI